MRLAGVAAVAGLLLAPTSALAAWREATSNHFVVYSEDPPEALRTYAERLERFDQALRYMHKLPDEPASVASRVTVYVVPTPAAVSRLGRRSALGFYLPRAGGAVAFTPRPSGIGGEQLMSGQEVLFHEYAHHFMLRNFRAAYPAWYVEGFAEFSATAQIERDGSVLVGRPPARAAYLAAGLQLNLPAMLAGDQARLSEAERADLYVRGWLLTHYLNFAPQRKGQLGAYLRALNAGTPSLEAARGAFGDLRELQRDLDSYAAGRLEAARVSAANARPGEIRVRELTPGEEATMSVRIRSDAGVDREAALALLPEARRAAQPFPDDPGAQLVLAEAAFDAGADAEAEAAADRALAADAKRSDAFYYKGRVRLRQAQASKDPSSPLWREARRLFAEANKLDPSDPDPLIWFYKSFPGEPNRNAVEGLMAAFELAPQDDMLRTQVARQHLLDGDGLAARRVLAPLAYSPHRGELRRLAGMVVAGIDAGKVRELAALLDEERVLTAGRSRS